VPAAATAESITATDGGSASGYAGRARAMSASLSGVSAIPQTSPCRPLSPPCYDADREATETGKAFGIRAALDSVAIFT
jgi:hypothetical protein